MAVAVRLRRRRAGAADADMHDAAAEIGEILSARIDHGDADPPAGESLAPGCGRAVDLRIERRQSRGDRGCAPGGDLLQIERDRVDALVLRQAVEVIDQDRDAYRPSEIAVPL